MNKCLPFIAAGIFTLLYPLTAFSFESLAVQAGADYWWSSNRINNDRRDQDNTLSYFFALEHDHSYLPNFKIRFSKVEAESVALDKYDYTFYYSPLNDEVLQLDLGITASQYTNSRYTDDQQQEYDFDGLIWSFYANGAIKVPDTNLDVIGEFDFRNKSGKKTADVLAGMEYTFDLTQADIVLRGGYRVMDYTFSGPGTSAPVEILIDGWFAGIKVAY